MDTDLGFMFHILLTFQLLYKITNFIMIAMHRYVIVPSSTPLLYSLLFFFSLAGLLSFIYIYVCISIYILKLGLHGKKKNMLYLLYSMSSCSLPSPYFKHHSSSRSLYYFHVVCSCCFIYVHV